MFSLILFTLFYPDKFSIILLWLTPGDSTRQSKNSGVEKVQLHLSGITLRTKIQGHTFHRERDFCSGDTFSVNQKLNISLFILYFFLQFSFLLENPVADEDDYRIEVLITLRRLERLDKDDYTEEERQEAEEVCIW